LSNLYGLVYLSEKRKWESETCKSVKWLKGASL
jgi:hypothetical protein